MKTTTDKAEAMVFQTHRQLIERIVSLKAEGRINGYSIHAQGGGVIAGVRKSDVWSYLAA